MKKSLRRKSSLNAAMIQHSNMIKLSRNNLGEGSAGTVPFLTDTTDLVVF